jgi:hypothetical protein
LNLQKSPYSLSYYLNVAFDFSASVPAELAYHDEDLGVRFYFEGRAEDLMMSPAEGKELEDLLSIDKIALSEEHREHQLVDLLENRLAPALRDLSSLQGIKEYDERKILANFIVSRSARRVLNVLPPTIRPQDVPIR